MESKEAEQKAGDNQAVARAINKTIKKVTEDLEVQKYNTAIAAMMQCVNDLYKTKAVSGISKDGSWKEALEGLVQLVAPFAPHMAEELWQELGHKDSVNVANWPRWDEKLIVDDVVTIGVQINGKLRSEVTIATDASQQDAINIAKADAKIAELIKAKQIQKEIYVPGRLVSLVIG